MPLCTHSTTLHLNPNPFQRISRSAKLFSGSSHHARFCADPFLPPSCTSLLSDMAASRGLSTFLLLLLAVTCMACSSQARNFFVGGRDGWVVNPSEDFNHWASRNRFQVHDNLVFLYKKGKDSVVQVSEQHYRSCNRSRPIRRMRSGHSFVTLDRSGPFFFVSGNEEHCQKGQKLTVVVLHDAGHRRAPVPLPSPPAYTPVPSPYIPPSAPSSSPSGSPSAAPASKGPSSPPRSAKGTSSPSSSDASVLGASVAAVMGLVLGGGAFLF